MQIFCCLFMHIMYFAWKLQLDVKTVWSTMVYTFRCNCNNDRYVSLCYIYVYFVINCLCMKNQKQKTAGVKLYGGSIRTSITMQKK